MFSRLLFLKFTSGMLASCVNYSVFQHLCQQLSEILFVVFLQRFEVTLLACSYYNAFQHPRQPHLANLLKLFMPVCLTCFYYTFI